MISASIVSHGHGDMVWQLVHQLERCPEISQIIVTLNIEEPSPAAQVEKVTIIRNESPKGFGENHNAAFTLATGNFYCVINPDIVLEKNPFPVLLATLNETGTGLVAPRVNNPYGVPEDSMRRFLTPWSMLMRVIGYDSGAYSQDKTPNAFSPEWVAGMFMLFRVEAYAKVSGFDERYFMYCEDADICTRLWKVGFAIAGCISVSVIHNAQRASRQNLKHLSWHVRSMTRYFLNHSFSLPQCKVGEDTRRI
jgi:N-acetylglucosaminyl-diphospho-decaprenol L-rhamnosyltransferase